MRVEQSSKRRVYKSLDRRALSNHQKPRERPMGHISLTHTARVNLSNPDLEILIKNKFLLS